MRMKMGKGKNMLQKHSAKASVLASMVVAAGAYVAVVVDALTVDYANIDGGDLKPKLTWEGTTAVDIERAESDQGPWTKMDTASAGTTTWTDNSTVVSKTYWYRLNDNGDTSAAQKFVAVRKLSASEGTVITQCLTYYGDGTRTAESVFDGRIDNAENYFCDGATSTTGTSTPKVGDRKSVV